MELESTMNWSPTKRTGQKRNIEAIAYDEESIATSSDGEEEEGEEEEGPEEGGRQNVGRNSDSTGGSKGKGEFRSREAGQTGKHDSATALQGAEGTRWGPGHREVNNTVEEKANAPLGQGGAANTGSPNPEKGIGTPLEIRRSKITVSANLQNDANLSKKHSRGGKCKGYWKMMLYQWM